MSKRSKKKASSPRVPANGREAQKRSANKKKGKSKRGPRKPGRAARSLRRPAQPIEIDWRPFDDGRDADRFEDMAVDLFVAECGEAAFTPNARRTGRDGG